MLSRLLGRNQKVVNIDDIPFINDGKCRKCGARLGNYRSRYTYGDEHGEGYLCPRCDRRAYETTWHDFD